jgi:hypothetical protein
LGFEGGTTQLTAEAFALVAALAAALARLFFDIVGSQSAGKMMAISLGFVSSRQLAVRDLIAGFT